MPVLASVIGVVVVAALVVVYLRLRQQDVMGALMDKRKSSSRVISRADFVEGGEAVPVALSLSADTLYYENPDLEASFELSRIDEVEYDDELTTGKNVMANQSVLRLRSHGRSFEFVLPKTEQPKWSAALPPRTLGGSPLEHAV